MEYSNYSNYTRVFLSSVVEQWKLVHLISVFLCSHMTSNIQVFCHLHI